MADWVRRKLSVCFRISFADLSMNQWTLALRTGIYITTVKQPNVTLFPKGA